MNNNYLPTDYQTFIATSRYARWLEEEDRKSTRLNSSHANIPYAVFRFKNQKTLHHIRNMLL